MGKFLEGKHYVSHGGMCMWMINNDDDLFQVEEPNHLQCRHEEADTLPFTQTPFLLVTYWRGLLIRTSSSFFLDFSEGQKGSASSWTVDLATTEGTLMYLN